MTWMYSQTRGTLSRNGRTISHGYSGYDQGKSDWSIQTVRSVGPIPEGNYIIGSPRHSNHVGAFAMPLTPASGKQTFGLNSFFMHGESAGRHGNVSGGCIIMDRITRERVWSSGDRQLRVVR
jgi:hypothetical protein